MTSKTRILIADDHSVVRMGLTSLLNAQKTFTVVGEAEDGESAVELANRLHPDVIIMDLMMPRKDGATATAEIVRNHPDIRILILTTFGAFNGVARALDSGATGAILKNTDNDELISAIIRVSHGQRFVAPEIRQLLAVDPPIPELSARQQDALGLVVRGLTNVDISKLMGIQEDSVKKLLGLTFEKIGAANRAEAVAIALRKHLLKI